MVEEGEEEGRVFSFQRDQVREVVLQSCATLQLAVMELETGFERECGFDGTP